MMPTSPYSPKKTKIVNKLFIWFVFSVVVSFTPFLGLFLWKDATGQSTSLTTLFSHGELLLISIAILSSALGESYLNRDKDNTFQAVAFGLSFALILTCAFSYFLIYSSTFPVTNINLSLSLTIGSIISSASIIYSVA